MLRDEKEDTRLVNVAGDIVSFGSNKGMLLFNGNLGGMK